MPLVLKQFRYAWTEHALLRFSKIPYEECNVNVPYCAATGEYPQLQDDTLLIPKNEIVPYILQLHDELNIGLTDEQKAESDILIAMIENTLSLFVAYRRWLKDTVYASITYKSYMEIVPFPLSLYCLYKGKKDAADLLRIEGYSNYKLIYKKAVSIYQALDIKLCECCNNNNNRGYLFGSNPSAVDAILFGHLMEALIEPIGIQDIITRYCPNLLKYVERIIKCYFSYNKSKIQHRSHNPFLTRLGIEVRLFPTEREIESNTREIEGEKCEDSKTLLLPEDEMNPELSTVLSFVSSSNNNNNNNNNKWENSDDGNCLNGSNCNKKSDKNNNEEKDANSNSITNSNSIWLMTVGLLTGAFIIFSHR